MFPIPRSFISANVRNVKRHRRLFVCRRLAITPSQKYTERWWSGAEANRKKDDLEKGERKSETGTTRGTSAVRNSTAQYSKNRTSQMYIKAKHVSVGMWALLCMLLPVYFFCSSSQFSLDKYLPGRRAHKEEKEAKKKHVFLLTWS